MLSDEKAERRYHRKYNKYKKLLHFDKSWFDNLIDVEFENEKFKIFADYDVWLTNYYGDYMKLPPKEEQEPHHEFDLYVEE